MTQDNSNRLPVDRKILTRFFEKIRIDPNVTFNGSPCWLWTAYLQSGYASFWYQGRNHNAHRMAYQFFVEILPSGHQSEGDHLCRRRNCVNPAHVEAVPARINTLRSTNPAAKNFQKTHCAHGHEFTADNTYWYGAKKNMRACRACKRRLGKSHKRNEAYKERRRAHGREYMRTRRAEIKNHKDKGAACAPAEMILPHGDSD